MDGDDGHGVVVRAPGIACDMPELTLARPLPLPLPLPLAEPGSSSPTAPPIRTADLGQRREEAAVDPDRARQGPFVVAASGRLAGEGSARLLGELREALRGNPAWLVVDMTEVTVLDSRCLAALVRVRKALHHTGGSLSLFNVPAAALAVVRAAGLDKVFDVRPLDGLLVSPGPLLERRGTGRAGTAAAG